MKTHSNIIRFCRNVIRRLTQLTTGGNRDADIATPINGPADPSSNASATPVPDVNAHAIPIHKERAFPLKYRERERE